MQEAFTAADDAEAQLLALGNRPGEIRFLDGCTGELLRSCRGHPLGVKAVSFSADGRTLATESDTAKR